MVPLLSRRLRLVPAQWVRSSTKRDGRPLEEIDIWRTAKILIDAHGDNAWLEAAQRADLAIEQGNREAESVWKRVGRAIEDLQQTKPSASEPLN